MSQIDAVVLTLILVIALAAAFVGYHLGALRSEACQRRQAHRDLPHWEGT